MDNFVTPILQGVGAVSNAYGAYLQSQQAERDYQQAIRAWQEEKDRQARLDAASTQQQQVQNGLSGGTYARSMSQDIQAPYLQYARSLGL